MATQFDLIAGFDLSGLLSCTQEQFMQAINQAAPLSDIGLIICKNSGVSGTDHPDVTNNLRFARYIWADFQTPSTPVLRVYKGTLPSDTFADWVAIVGGGTPSSITTNMITLVSDTGGVAIPQLKRALDGSADGTFANWLVRVDPQGRYCEIASIDTILSEIPNGIRLSYITGLKADALTHRQRNQYLGVTNDQQLDYKYLNPVDDIISYVDGSGLDNRLPATSIAPGGRANTGYVLRTNEDGTKVEWARIDEIISNIAIYNISNTYNTSNPYTGAIRVIDFDSNRDSIDPGTTAPITSNPAIPGMVPCVLDFPKSGAGGSFPYAVAWKKVSDIVSGNFGTFARTFFLSNNALSFWAVTTAVQYFFINAFGSISSTSAIPLFKIVIVNTSGTDDGFLKPGSEIPFEALHYADVADGSGAQTQCYGAYSGPLGAIPYTILLGWAVKHGYWVYVWGSNFKIDPTKWKIKCYAFL